MKKTIKLKHSHDKKQETKEYTNKANKHKNKTDDKDTKKITLTDLGRRDGSKDIEKTMEKNDEKPKGTTPQNNNNTSSRKTDTKINPTQDIYHDRALHKGTQPNHQTKKINQATSRANDQKTEDTKQKITVPKVLKQHTPTRKPKHNAGKNTRQTTRSKEAANNHRATKNSAETQTANQTKKNIMSDPKIIKQKSEDKHKNNNYSQKANTEMQS
ncbi:hypothetical protein [Bacteroides graminisolvens]|uniref:hypothetical protein n=1 Tax=Bacteroides graminisolvens TaxID=477666 RepID=UPI000410E3BB|nr:hypothetical protein [Bacteroides graminisolvens]